MTGRQPGTDGMAGLAGQLQLRAGAALGRSLVSTRPAGLLRALHGQPAAALPGLLASLFSLCGPVHRLCAELALRSAATGAAVLPAEAQRRLLQLHSLRAQAQGVLMDWPRWLATDPAPAADTGLALLATSPLRSALPTGVAAQAAHQAAWAGWLAQALFQQPLASWLAAWQADPQQALQAWVAQTAARNPVARWLQAARPWASQPLPHQPGLQAHGQPAALAALVAEALAQPRGRQQPRWQGRCAETGPWARLADPPAQRLHTPWLRLGARLADLAQLALADGTGQGAQRLALGAVPLGTWPGRHGGQGAIAWVETARGLLLHALWLAPPAPGAAPVLADGLVLSPTDWNAHPAGGWAQALAALPAGAPPAAVMALAAAYDPCVPCTITPSAAHSAPQPEARHA